MPDPILFHPADRRGPLPLVLGVTGHRDLRPEEDAALRESVAGIIRLLKKKYRHTPLVLVSALAEGADRLVAEVALANNVRLIAALPMPRQEYLNDFPEESSRQRFAWLLDRAEHVVELDLAPGNTAESICQSADDRARQYAEVGKFIVRHSQVLIALWDGHDSDKPGGTAQVVKWFQNPDTLEPAGFHPHRPKAEPGALCHVVTSRQSQASPLGAVTKWPTDFLRACQRGFAQLDSFNKDAASCLSAGSFVRSRDDLLPLGEALALGKPLSATLANLRECYAVADGLALHYQRWHARFQMCLWVGTMLAAFFFQLFFKRPEVVWAKTAHGVFYTLLFGLWAFMYWKSFDVKHTIYRALAEGMRVFFFWRLAGLDPVRASQSLHWLHNDLPWVPAALRAWALTAEREWAPGAAPLPPAVASADRRDLVGRYWIQNQLDYFRTKIDRLSRSQRRLFWLQMSFFLVGVPCCALWIIANYTSLLDENWGWLKNAERFGPVLGPVLDVLNVFAAFFLITLGVYFYKRRNNAAERRILKEFTRMKAVFDQAAPAIMSGSPEQQADNLQKLGSRALEENGNWVSATLLTPGDDGPGDD